MDSENQEIYSLFELKLDLFLFLLLQFWIFLKVHRDGQAFFLTFHIENKKIVVPFLNEKWTYFFYSYFPSNDFLKVNSDGQAFFLAFNSENKEIIVVFIASYFNKNWIHF